MPEQNFIQLLSQLGLGLAGWLIAGFLWRRYEILEIDYREAIREIVELRQEVKKQGDCKPPAT